MSFSLVVPSDSHVLTVVGRYVDLDDGSSLEVDKIYEPDTDSLSVSSHSLCYSEASDRYKPSFDKSMQRRQFRIGVNLFNWYAYVLVTWANEGTRSSTIAFALCSLLFWLS